MEDDRGGEERGPNEILGMDVKREGSGGGEMGIWGRWAAAADILSWDCLRAARRMLDVVWNSSLSAVMDDMVCNRVGICISANDGTQIGVLDTFFFFTAAGREDGGIEEGEVEVLRGGRERDDEGRKG